MDLTVIVCTIPERKQLLSRCLWHLEHQSCDEFEVIVAHGAGPKGDKVNRALPLVSTSHVMFVDDDDWVSPLLVERVLPHTEDWVGYDALQMVEGRYAATLSHEIASHICPLRTDLARTVPFGNTYLDDIIWTRTVAPMVESSAYIDEVLYFYDKWNPPGGSGWSPPRQVGPWPHEKIRHRWI